MAFFFFFLAWQFLWTPARSKEGNLPFFPLGQRLLEGVSIEGLFFLERNFEGQKNTFFPLFVPLFFP